jgi:hypothetical protein
MTPTTQATPACSSTTGASNLNEDFAPSSLDPSLPQSGTNPGKKPSQRWKSLERTTASKLGGRRIVRQDFFESSPDVVIDDFQIICECKAHKRFSFHKFMDQARKYCRPDEIPIVVTKAEGQISEYAIVPIDFLAALLDEIRAARRAGL